MTSREVNSLWDTRYLKLVKGVQTQLTLADLSCWRFHFSGWGSARPFLPVTLGPPSAHCLWRLLSLHGWWNAWRLAINLQVTSLTEFDYIPIFSFWPDFLTNTKAVWFCFSNFMISLGASHSWFLTSPLSKCVILFFSAYTASGNFFKYCDFSQWEEYRLCWFELSWWLCGSRICLQYRRHRRCELDPWVGKIPWRRKWQPTPTLLLEKPNGQNSLVGCDPKGCKESDTPERLSTRQSVFIPFSSDDTEIMPNNRGQEYGLRR